MKKAIFGVLFLLAGALAYRWQMPTPIPRPPAPTAEPAPDIHEALRRFPIADKPEERFLLANQIAYVKMGPELPALTEQEKKAMDEAEEYQFRVRELAEKFESTLTRQEVELVTESEPDSRFRKAGSLHPTSPCDPAEREALRKRLPGQKLDQEFLAHAMGLVVLYDDEHREDFNRRLIQLLARKEGYPDSRELIGMYRTDGARLKAMMEQLRPGPPAHGIEESEKFFVAKGIEPAKVKSYLLGLAQEFPGCVGGFNLELLPTFPASR